MDVAEQLLERVRQVALAYPEAVEEAPWGERVAKVRKKVFVFYSCGKTLNFTFKLPESKGLVLDREDAKPTGYGLGRHGWVSLSMAPDALANEADLLDWLDESYRAVAPKRLIKQLTAPPEAPSPQPATLTGQRILVIGRDPLRRARCTEALVARGADVVGVDLQDALDAAAQGAPDRVVMDLSRDAQMAIAVLGDLGAVTDAPLHVAGTRNAQQERTLPSSLATVSREAPGDPRFLDLWA